MSSKGPGSSSALPQTQVLSFPRVVPSDAYVLRTATVALVLCDLIVATASFLVAFYLRHNEAVFYRPLGAWLPTDITWGFRPYFVLLAFIPVVRILTLRYYGLYQLRGEYAFFEDATHLVKAVTMSSLFVIVIVFFFRGGFAFQTFSYSRLVFVYDWALALGGYALVRILLRSLQNILRRRSLNLIPTLVVGTGQSSQVCIAEISEEPRLGYYVVGALATSSSTPEELEKGEVQGVPILGQFDDLPALAKQSGVTEILITDSTLPSRDIFQSMMRVGRKHHLTFRVVPNLFNCLPRKTEIDQIGSLPMIKLFEDPLAGPNRILKRTIDIVGASVGIILLTPFWAVIAFLIKRESPGPALYKQERVGMDGRVFQMYKFRSMRVDADDSIHREVMRQNITNAQSANQGDDEQPIFGKIANDPRLTQIGEWIRRYSVDELPNLLNVLIGEMSLVGPRPPIPYEVEMYEEWHRSRFNIKPGITGLWQVSGRNRLNFEQMVQLDLYYIENWSIWLELKILLLTIPVVLRGDNAY